MTLSAADWDGTLNVDGRFSRNSRMNLSLSDGIGQCVLRQIRRTGNRPGGVSIVHFLNFPEWTSSWAWV